MKHVIDTFMLLAALNMVLLFGLQPPSAVHAVETSAFHRRYLLLQGWSGWLNWGVGFGAVCGLLLGPAFAAARPSVPSQVAALAAAVLLVATRLLAQWAEPYRLASQTPNPVRGFAPVALVLAVALSAGIWAGRLPAGLLAGTMVAVLFVESTVAFYGLDQQRREAGDAAWRSRLAPHFLFNLFNSLQAQIAQDPKGAQATTEHLGRLFRQLLALSQRPTVSLAEELAFVEDLLALQRARLGSRLNVEIDIPEELESLELPTLALQTLVENAIKHGVEPREERSTLRITATQVPTYGEFQTFQDLKLTVESPSGPGGTQGTGTGLASLRGRLRKPEDLTIDQGATRFTASLTWRQP